MAKTHLALPSSPDVHRLNEEHAYFNADGSVNGEKLLAMLNEAPGAFDLIMLEGILSELSPNSRSKYHNLAREIVSEISRVVILAAYGSDELADDQLKAIKKLARPAKYELPANKIRELIDRYETSPTLARGWEMRRLMSYLSFVVQPRTLDRPYSIDRPIVLRPESPAPVFQPLWGLAKDHWRPNATLQSLAIRIYLEDLQTKGITDADESITERTLKRDLKNVRVWEATASKEEKQGRGSWHGHSLSELPISWCDFSEGWKVRRQTRSKTKRGAKQLTK